ncbi:hypothetical protein [Candidatus Ponderosibacter sp. Uisw_141_02]|uniref:hypothetical protein n=1 Tax=Candidatus Ponderosibacter sp. Uisw_141_02 TaxID=3231000 RepID=UPI003D48FD55
MPLYPHYFAGTLGQAINEGMASNHHSRNSNFRVNVHGVLSLFHLNRISTRRLSGVRNRYFTIAAIAAIGMMTTSCQLLIDNRKTGKTSVVVVPTDEWDALRGEQMRPAITRDIAKEMAADIADELKSVQSTNAAAPPAEPMITPVKRPAPTPIDGSQIIQFSNRSNSQLAGCSSIGIIEVLHTGTIDEALIILKNEAYRLNTNILVPLKMNQTDVDPIASPNIKIDARMMKCPLKLARGN